MGNMFWNYRGMTLDLLRKQPFPMKDSLTVNTLKHALFPRLDILAFSHSKQEEIKLETSMDTFFFSLKAPYTLRSFKD